MASKFTDNFNLDLYEDKDPANLRDQYNDSMQKIDSNMLSINNNAKNAQKEAEKANAAASQNAEAINEANKKIEKNANDIASNNQKISDLNNKVDSNKAQTDQNIDQIKNNTYTKDESNDRFQLIDKNNYHVIMFGDSYTDIATNRAWWAYLKNLSYFKARKPYIWHNYAKGGYGYIPPNGTYQSEFETAKNDITYDHSLVKFVFVAGSRNSNDGYSGQIKTAATTLFTNIRNEFPNARVIVIPLMWDYRQFSNYYRYNAASIENAAAIALAESIPWAWTWCYGYDDPNWFTGEDIHPLAPAARTMASYINRYLEGGYTGRHEAITLRHPTNPTAWNFSAIADGGNITYSANILAGNTASELLTMGTLPKWAWPENDPTNGAPVWVSMISNNADSTTLFKINDDGTFGIQPFTTKPSGTPNGNAAFQLTKPW